MDKKSSKSIRKIDKNEIYPTGLWIRRVNEEMLKRGIKAPALAQKAKLPYQTLYKIICGKNEPSFEKQEKIAAALGVPGAWYLLVDDASKISPMDPARIAMIQAKADAQVARRREASRIIGAVLEGMTPAERADILKGLWPSSDALAESYGADKSQWPPDIRVLSGSDINSSRGRSSKPSKTHPARRMARVPIVGLIAAGQPIEATQTLGETIEVPEDELPANGDFFALRVRGDSMQDEGIRDRDLVICRRQETADNGQTVVALIGVDATLKKLYREPDGQIRLQPANAAHKPIFVKPEDLRIQGIVVKVIKRGES